MLKKILGGFLAGLISGFFTAGGGLILVPAFVYILKMDEKTSRATSILCILPMVIVTAIFYNNRHFRNWDRDLKCALVGVIGAILGTKLLKKIPDKYLKITFIIFLLYAGVNLIIK